MPDKVEDEDCGWEKIVEEFTAAGIIADVGVQEDGEERQEGTVSNADLALIHEFGTETVPERSFMRSSFDENEEEYAQMLERGSKKILAGELSALQVVEAVAEKCVSDMKNKIDSNIPPDLQEETILRKGSSVALIDTAQMKNSLVPVVYEQDDPGDEDAA